jgi:hypothetical protein
VKLFPKTWTIPFLPSDQIWLLPNKNILIFIEKSLWNDTWNKNLTRNALTKFFFSLLLFFSCNFAMLCDVFALLHGTGLSIKYHFLAKIFLDKSLLRITPKIWIREYHKLNFIQVFFFHKSRYFWKVSNANVLDQNKNLINVHFYNGFLPNISQLICIFSTSSILTWQQVNFYIVFSRKIDFIC